MWTRIGQLDGIPATHDHPSLTAAREANHAAILRVGDDVSLIVDGAGTAVSTPRERYGARAEGRSGIVGQRGPLTN